MNTFGETVNTVAGQGTSSKFKGRPMLIIGQVLEYLLISFLALTPFMFIVLLTAKPSWVLNDDGTYNYPVMFGIAAGFGFVIAIGLSVCVALTRLAAEKSGRKEIADLVASGTLVPGINKSVVT